MIEHFLDWTGHCVGKTGWTVYVRGQDRTTRAHKTGHFVDKTGHCVDWSGQRVEL